MHTLTKVRFASLWAGVIILTACAALGTPTPKTFTERMAAAYIAVDTVNKTGTALLINGKLKVADAENIHKTADTALAGLDVAKTLPAAAAEDKLSTTLLILTELQKYLNTRAK